jgi:hypothetical protein
MTAHYETVAHVSYEFEGEGVIQSWRLIAAFTAT